MAAESIPPDIKRFIGGYISSVEQLEVLRLFGENPDRSWTPAEVLQIIQSSEKSIADCLEHFRAAGILSAQPEHRFRFASNDPNLTQTVEMLVKTYRERRVSVIECIYTKPAGPIQDFADAFRLRKGK